MESFVAIFDSDVELSRWKAHCSKFYATLKNKSIAHLLSQDADPIFSLTQQCAHC